MLPEECEDAVPAQAQVTEPARPGASYHCKFILGERVLFTGLPLGPELARVEYILIRKRKAHNKQAKIIRKYGLVLLEDARSVEAESHQMKSYPKV